MTPPPDEDDSPPTDATATDATPAANDPSPKRPATGQGFGSGKGGKTTPKALRMLLQELIEQTFLQHGTIEGTCRAVAAWPRVTALCGGKPMPVGTCKNHLREIRKRWEQRRDNRMSLLEQHRRMLLRRILKAEADGAWGAVMGGHRLISELDGMVGQLRIEPDQKIEVIVRLDDGSSSAIDPADPALVK